MVDTRPARCTVPSHCPTKIHKSQDLYHRRYRKSFRPVCQASRRRLAQRRKAATPAAGCDGIDIDSGFRCFDPNLNDYPKKMAPDSLSHPFCAVGPLLDKPWYSGIDDLNKRIPHPMRLTKCNHLTVQGNLLFGKEITIEGDVTLINQAKNQKTIADRTTFNSGTFTI